MARPRRARRWRAGTRVVRRDEWTRSRRGKVYRPITVFAAFAFWFALLPHSFSHSSLPSRAAWLTRSSHHLNGAPVWLSCHRSSVSESRCHCRPKWPRSNSVSLITVCFVWMCRLCWRHSTASDAASASLLPLSLVKLEKPETLSAAHRHTCCTRRGLTRRRALAVPGWEAREGETG